MEHFLKGIAPLGHWYINPNGKSNTFKFSLLVLSYLTKALTEHFLKGNVPLRYLLNAKPLAVHFLTSCKRLGHQSSSFFTSCREKSFELCFFQASITYSLQYIPSYQFCRSVYYLWNLILLRVFLNSIPCGHNCKTAHQHFH